MQFLAVCRRRTERFTTEQFAALADAEAEGVRQLYADGVVRAAWGREDVPGACLLVESNSLDEANAKLRTLPFAKNDMLEVQLIPLCGYRGFGPRG